MTDFEKESEMKLKFTKGIPYSGMMCKSYWWGWDCDDETIVCEIRRNSSDYYLCFFGCGQNGFERGYNQKSFKTLKKAKQFAFINANVFYKV